MFRLSDKVLERFRTYLEQRSQRLSAHGILSDVQFLLSGVSQGSVLASLVFPMVTRPLGIIAQPCGVIYHIHADDQQLYIFIYLASPHSVKSLKTPALQIGAS